MKNLNNSKFIVVILILLFSCNQNEKKILEHAILFENILISHKLNDAIQQHNIRFFKDFNLLTLEGTYELNPLQVSFPFVITSEDKNNNLIRIYYQFSKNYTLNRYYIIKKDNNYFEYDYSHFKIASYYLSFFYPTNAMQKIFEYNCKEYTFIKSQNEFSDTLCILSSYKVSNIVNDTMINKKYTFDCCDFEEPPFRNRSTYRMFLNKDFSHQKLINSPEIINFEYQKFYEQENNFVMEKYSNCENPKLTKTYYDKQKYISINWVFALFSYY